MHEELASIREVVSLSAREILDSAESLLSRLGYDTTQRREYFLRAQRRAALESAGQDLYTVLVTASPQAAGGVRVAVHGDDREGVQERQEEWAEWATSLPKLDANASELACQICRNSNAATEGHFKCTGHLRSARSAREDRGWPSTGRGNRSRLRR
jgi:hypothetical protein